MKRGFDILFALFALAVSLPFILLAALGIKLSSPGPVFYRAIRAGRGGAPFAMLKLRTMHDAPQGAVITAENDPRIFRLGNLLRKPKIDELPQFLNVLSGDMSVVGPRPEDPKIVAQHYTDWMHETLSVRPGLTSPGAIFYYAYGDRLIDPADPEGTYVARMLAPKLAIERAYLDRATLVGDLRVILGTVAAVIGQAMGRPLHLSARNRQGAEAWCPAEAFPDKKPAR